MTHYKLKNQYIYYISNIKLFESKKICSVWSEAEQKWYFSIQEVVEVLTDTVDAKDYIKKMKKRDESLNSNWGGQFVPSLKWKRQMAKNAPYKVAMLPEMPGAIWKRKQAKRL